MAQPVVAVVVAAGLGVRYGGNTPKAALKLTGKSLLALSVEALAAGGCTHAMVVLNPKAARWLTKDLSRLPIPVVQTQGGTTRQESVHNGLKAVRDDPRLAQAQVVLIHDAVRPMVPASVVADVIQAVRDGAQAVAPAVTVSDSMRILAPGGLSTVIDRANLRAIQTPQGFPLDIILAAHDQMAASGGQFTDDVSCAEQAGHQVALVPGSRLSMKITEPGDLLVAKALWKARRQFGHHSVQRPRRPGWPL